MHAILNDILKMIRLSGTVYFQMDFAEPWGMKMEQGKFAQFHIVTKGECLIKTPMAKKPFLAKEGDVIAFLQGDEHWIADSEKSEKIPGQMIYESFINSEPIFAKKPCSTRLVCGHFEFDSKLEHPFLQNLPRMIHLTNRERKGQIQTIVSSITEETKTEEEIEISEPDAETEGTEIPVEKREAVITEEKSEEEQPAETVEKVEDKQDTKTEEEVKPKVAANKPQ